MEIWNLFGAMGCLAEVFQANPIGAVLVIVFVATGAWSLRAWKKADHASTAELARPGRGLRVSVSLVQVMLEREADK